MFSGSGVVVGSIPACTGEPNTLRVGGSVVRVYPRVYGGTMTTPVAPRSRRGLSPRVRGNRVGADASRLGRGSIPACTGEPVVHAWRHLEDGVYPRVYGGTSIGAGYSLSDGGLSPRVRGNQGAVGGNGAPLRVYPRVYGGTRGIQHDRGASVGLSPRVRGNLCPSRLGRSRRGSIPACTGEPPRDDIRCCQCGVYPRVYGGTDADPDNLYEGWGLSPRVRGNRHIGIDVEPGDGSIPACTGEPGAEGRSPDLSWVYPRVYGGTDRPVAAAVLVGGLSPRVRGNPVRNRARSVVHGSIPACTGEPRRLPLSSSPMRVYPRVYGGTRPRSRQTVETQGLSPRVRGNRVHVASWAFQLGSIPACTGEPKQSSGVRLVIRVYPRVYGGTLDEVGQAIAYTGLSPRVRGNRRAPHGRLPRGGSIPACTGEPSIDSSSLRWLRVYPRVYGGTVGWLRGCRLHPGLSPRVRGNLGQSIWLRPRRGSIPACTGEPSLQPAMRARSGVYPRVYGGTHDNRVARFRQQGLSPRVRGNLLLLNY